MPSTATAPLSAAFVDAHHARRALGLMAILVDHPVHAAIRDSAVGDLTIVDIDVAADLHAMISGLVRTTGGRMLW